MIANLKAEVVLNQSQNISTLKSKIESQMKEPLTIASINTLLEKLPSKEANDTIGQSYIVQYLWAKLRAKEYMMTIENDSVKLLAKDIDDANVLPFTDTINSYIRAGRLSLADCTQAIMIGSGTIGEYIETRKAMPTDISNADYIDYLREKYTLSQNFTSSEIGGKNIPAEDKSLLLSSMDKNFSNMDMKQVTKNYTEMKIQAKEVFESKTFQAIEKAIGGTPTNAKDLADQVTKDPSILAGKPLTVIAGGIAAIMALGHEKGK